VAALCHLYRQHEYAHIPGLVRKHGLPISASADFSKLRFWGLVEELDDIRADGSPRNGYWRITPKGRKFVRGEITIPKYRLFLSGIDLGVPEDSPQLGIREALGSQFDYLEILRVDPELF